MQTQFYDKVDAYNTLGYTGSSHKQGEFEETLNDYINCSLVLERLPQEKHMPYLCWLYNDGIHQECIGITTCAVGMLNASPTGKKTLLFKLLIIQIMLIDPFWDI